MYPLSVKNVIGILIFKMICPSYFAICSKCMFYWSLNMGSVDLVVIPSIGSFIKFEMSFTCVMGFIPRHSWKLLYGNSLCDLLPTWSLLVYQKLPLFVCWFFIFNIFIRSKWFWLNFKCFHKTNSSEYRNNLSSSFATNINFISFTSLVSLDKNTNHILNKNWESGDLSLIPHFRLNTFSFLPFINVGYRFDYIAYLCYGMILTFLESLGFLSWSDVEFCQRICSAFLEVLRFFCLIQFICCIMFIVLFMLDHPCIPGMKPTSPGYVVF
jgi:hypothetical protein